jgi:hypothetical protein
MILKTEAYLLSKDNARREFQQLLDKSKRNITASRGKNSPLKRVYSIDLESRYNMLLKVFEGNKIDDASIGTKMRDPSFSPELMFCYKYFSGLEIDNLYSKEEIETFNSLNENDMKNNVYLGQSEA